MRSQNPNKEKEFTDLMNDYQKFVNSGKLSASDTQNAQLIISRLNNAITTKNINIVTKQFVNMYIVNKTLVICYNRQKYFNY